jgi:hypothetical protein
MPYEHIPGEPHGEHQPPGGGRRAERPLRIDDKDDEDGAEACHGLVAQSAMAGGEKAGEKPETDGVPDHSPGEVRVPIP